MLRFLSIAAAAAALAFVPSAGLGTNPGVRPAAAAATAPAAASAQSALAASAATFGVDLTRAQMPDSGLAPGQTAADFEAWLRAPEHRARLGAFRDYLAAAGVASIVPIWQLTRTSSSWRECGAEPFEAPPQDKWAHIVTTLKFVRDDVEPAVGKVEPLSAYRNEALNKCSHGAPESAHRNFFALDLTPVSQAVDRGAIIRSVCAAHARDGRAYDTGLGFYSGRRFHVDSAGFRKWGPDGKGATSPCVTQA
jgi:hypothetical protein